jgi:hypothetical protein
VFELDFSRPGRGSEDVDADVDAEFVEIESEVVVEVREDIWLNDV